MKTLPGMMVLLACATILAAEVDNPYKAAKVGDWTAYKSTVTINDMPPQESESKNTVVKKTDEECVVEVVHKIGGQATPPTTQTIKLAGKHDDKQKYTGCEVKELGQGEETLTVSGTAYKTKWTEKQVVPQGAEAGAAYTVKTWHCSEVPLDGIVRMIDKHAVFTMELALTGCGRGK